MGLIAAGCKKRDRHVFARASLRLPLLLKGPKSPFFALRFAYSEREDALNA